MYINLEWVNTKPNNFDDASDGTQSDANILWCWNGIADETAAANW